MDQGTERTATQKSLAKEVSPLDSALEQNNYFLEDIESQLETLANRLAPVSSSVPSGPGPDKSDPRGNSPVVEVVGNQSFKLSNISARLAEITRNLEV